MEPNIESNIEPNYEPNNEPNIKLNIDPNMEPNQIVSRTRTIFLHPPNLHTAAVFVAVRNFF